MDDSTIRHAWLCLLLEHIPKENFQLIKAVDAKTFEPKIGCKVYIYDTVTGKKHARALPHELQWHEIPPKSPLVKALNEDETYGFGFVDKDLYENGGYETVNSKETAIHIKTIDDLEALLSRRMHSTNKIVKGIDSLTFMPEIYFIHKNLWEQQRKVKLLAKITLEVAQECKAYDRDKYPNVALAEELMNGK